MWIYFWRLEQRRFIFSILWALSFGTGVATSQIDLKIRRFDSLFKIHRGDELGALTLGKGSSKSIKCFLQNKKQIDIKAFDNKSFRVTVISKGSDQSMKIYL